MRFDNSQPANYLDLVKMEPILDDYEVDFVIPQPFGLIVPKIITRYPKFRFTGYERMGWGAVRRYEAEFLLAGPMIISTERISLPLARDN